MAYLKKQRVGERTYFYIVQLVQRNGKYREKTLEALGRDRDSQRSPNGRNW